MNTLNTTKSITNIKSTPPALTFARSTTSFIGGVCQGNCSANNGIGYCSILNGTTYALLYKTTDYGVTWSLITPPSGPCGGVSTNAADTALLLSYTGNNSMVKSFNGGASWTTVPWYVVSSTGSVMARNTVNNLAILQRQDIYYYVFGLNNDSTQGGDALSNWQDGDRAGILPGSNSISNQPNYFATTMTGYYVYRNSVQNVLQANNMAFRVSITTLDGGPLNQNYIGTCCNATNSVNLIVNRTHSAGGGRIYRTTAWNGTFTAVTGSPVELWRQIATSSAGNLVCAIADTKIYISSNAGLTWTNIAYNPALASGEFFKFVTVSPDEKFISVATDNGTSPKIFYLAL